MSRTARRSGYPDLLDPVSPNLPDIPGDSTIYQCIETGETAEKEEEQARSSAPIGGESTDDRRHDCPRLGYCSRLRRVISLASLAQEERGVD